MDTVEDEQLYALDRLSHPAKLHGHQLVCTEGTILLVILAGGEKQADEQAGYAIFNSVTKKKH